MYSVGYQLRFHYRSLENNGFDATDESSIMIEKNSLLCKSNCICAHCHTFLVCRIYDSALSSILAWSSERFLCSRFLWQHFVSSQIILIARK